MAGELIKGENSGRTFKQRERMGSGQHGYVFRANENNRTYALKQPIPYAPTIDIIRKEGAIQSEMAHAHIAPVVLFDAYTNESGREIPFIVTPLAQTDLQAYLDKRGPLPPEQALALSEQIAGALDAIHKKDVIFSDMKPSNVLLYKSADNAILGRVTDFGGAIHTDFPKGEYPWVSPAYAAPEASLKVSELTTAADQYGWVMGVVYPALIGKSPLEETENFSDKQSLPPFKTLLANRMTLLHEAFEPVVTRASQQNPKERYASMEELLDDLTSRKVKAKEQQSKQLRTL
jgi:serine/threonine protein kinase